jgi:hypothetical protein
MSDWGESEYRGCGQVLITLVVVLAACLGGGAWLLIRGGI